MKDKSKTYNMLSVFAFHNPTWIWDAPLSKEADNPYHIQQQKDVFEME